jgi:hypothetical protein
MAATVAQHDDCALHLHVWNIELPTYAWTYVQSGLGH